MKKTLYYASSILVGFGIALNISYLLGYGAGVVAVIGVSSIAAGVLLGLVYEHIAEDGKMMKPQEFAGMMAGSFGYMFVATLAYFVSDWLYGLEWRGWWCLFITGGGSLLFMAGSALIEASNKPGDLGSPNFSFRHNGYEEWLLQSVAPDAEVRRVAVGDVEQIWNAAREEK